MLTFSAATGEIDLKYLDAEGFCAWSEPCYTYYQRGEQKHLEQTLRRGRRLSIIGFLQPSISFVYRLVIGGVKRKSYISDDGARSPGSRTGWADESHSPGQGSNS